MKRLLAGLVVVLLVAAYLGGYWPQRERLAQARAETAACRQELAVARSALAQAEASNRLGRVFGQFLALNEAAAAANYGDAQKLSSPFFDQVRAEAEATAAGARRTALDSILARRDTVTAALARGEASVGESLRAIELDLRLSLDYPVARPAVPAPGPTPKEAPVQPVS